MNLSTIVVIASIIAGALAIPFVSNPTFDVLNSYDETLEPILNQTISSSTQAKKYPGAVERSLGPDSFLYKTNTAFGVLSVEISNKDKLNTKQKLVNPEASIEYTTTNNGMINEQWILTTKQYTLTTSKNYTDVTETFRAPKGTCTKVQTKGTAKESCSGDLYNIEDDWNIARAVMREYMEKIKNATEKIELTDIQDDEWNI